MNDIACSFLRKHFKAMANDFSVIHLVIKKYTSCIIYDLFSDTTYAQSSESIYATPSDDVYIDRESFKKRTAHALLMNLHFADVRNRFSHAVVTIVIKYAA